MKNEKQNQLQKVDFTDAQDVTIKDYRTPNCHYGSLQNQIVNSKYFNKNESSLRQSLTNQFETRLSYL